MSANLFDFCAQRQKILERVRLLVRVSQQGGGVEGRHKKYAAFFNEFAVALSYLIILINQLLGGYSAEANYNLGLNQARLLAQPAYTLLLLIGQGVSVFGRAAFNHIRYVDVAFAAQTDGVKVFIKQLTASADEGLALQILVSPGTLADE